MPCYRRDYKSAKGIQPARIKHDANAKIRQLEFELIQTRSIYERAVGVDCRVRWRKKITALEFALEEAKCVLGSSAVPVSAC